MGACAISGVTDMSVHSYMSASAHLFRYDMKLVYDASFRSLGLVQGRSRVDMKQGSGQYELVACVRCCFWAHFRAFVGMPGPLLDVAAASQDSFADPASLQRV